MKFLANENFPFSSIRILRDNGFEVISIAETIGGAKDIEVFNKAVNENLIILTFDKDYGEMIFKHKLSSPPEVIFFRIKNNFPEDAANILLDRINKEKIKFASYFTVIEDEGTRQRRIKHL